MSRFSHQMLGLLSAVSNLHDFLSSHESQYGRNGQSVGSYRNCSGIDDKVTTVDVFISDCHAVDSLHIQITTTDKRFVTRFLVDLLNADAQSRHVVHRDATT